MKSLVIVSVTLLAFSGNFLLRDNTSTLTKKGSEEFAAGRHAEALKRFDEVLRRKKSSRSLFNAGTASIAAGEVQRGISHLRLAANDDRGIAADSHYNEGNALLASDVEGAIRSYKAALRRDATHAAAKRNLEIAMRRREQQPRDGKGKGDEKSEQQGGGSGRDPKEQSDSSQPEGEQPQQRGETDAEQLLRAVEQQEREEISRMRKARARERAIGW